MKIGFLLVLIVGMILAGRYLGIGEKVRALTKRNPDKLSPDF